MGGEETTLRPEGFGDDLTGRGIARSVAVFPCCASEIFVCKRILSEFYRPDVLPWFESGVLAL